MSKLNRNSKIKVKLLTDGKLFTVPVVVTGRKTNKYIIDVPMSIALKHIYTSIVIKEVKRQRTYDGDTNTIKKYLEPQTSEDRKAVARLMLSLMMKGLKVLIHNKDGDLTSVYMNPVPDDSCSNIRINLDLAEELGLNLESKTISGYAYKENLIKKLIARL